MGWNSSFNLKTKNLVLTKLCKMFDKIEKLKHRLKSKQGHKIRYLAIKIKLNDVQTFFVQVDFLIDLGQNYNFSEVP